MASKPAKTGTIPQRLERPIAQPCLDLTPSSTGPTFCPGRLDAQLPDRGDKTVIVSCPECSTHYSHADENALELGRCSHCDARFPLSGQKRRYVVMPAVQSGSPDPLLATGLAETQTRVDRPAEATAEGVDFPALPDAPAPEPGDAEDDGFFGTGMDDDEALFGIDETPTDPPADAGPQVDIAEPTERRPDHPVREALGVFLLAGLGGVAGFHGATQFGFEPLKAVAVGLGVGLTLGWAWIRWAERKR